MFQPFVQLDSSLSRQHEGTGLGLALVQKLTDLHGGSVHVESEVGRGSRFTINLNCKQNSSTDAGTLSSTPNLPVPPQLEPQGIAKQDSGERGVILLAEDNLPNILTIGEYLESYRYEVIVAHDGLEALAKAEEFNPDLILMDIQMPAMNGLDAIAHLRAKPRFASTPIIALTALAMPGDRERCLQAGANEYMSKPVSLKMLVTTINAMLSP
jgi:CheY-like chemotaxis protein